MYKCADRGAISYCPTIRCAAGFRRDAGVWKEETPSIDTRRPELVAQTSTQDSDALTNLTSFGVDLFLRQPQSLRRFAVHINDTT